MADTTERPKVPSIIAVRMSEADLEIAAELVQLTGITEGSQLMRFSLRAAHREMIGLHAKAKASTPGHTPISED